MLKYAEKSFLNKYDLSLDFFRQIEEEVLEAIPLRKVYIINTTSGKKILKRMEYSKEKIEFIDWCTTSLSKEWSKIVNFKRFSNGSCFKEWKGDYYVVMNLIEGREVNFSNPIEYKMAINLIADFHNAGKKIIGQLLKSNKETVNKFLDQSLIEKYNSDISDIKQIYEWVKKYKYMNQFDSLFISEAENYIKEMESARDMLINSNYNMLRDTYEELVICHNDLAEHNFIINECNINIIDFDYATVDLRSKDIADLILKGIKNVAFEVEKGIEALEEYNRVNKLSKDEKEIIYIMLLFPRDVCSLVKSYYYKSKEWDENVFISRLKNKIINDEYRREFLKHLDLNSFND